MAPEIWKTRSAYSKTSVPARSIVLFEDQVVDAVALYLRRRGYEIRQKLRSTQRGHDLIAFKAGRVSREIYVEAKGEGSSRSGSARYGRSFISGQVFDHVAKAILKALRITSALGGQAEKRAAVALPDDVLHRKEIEQVMPALQQLDVAVFWVGRNRQVSFVATWEL